MGLDAILAKLGVGSRETVYLSVTPGVGLELVQLDAQTKTVKNYNFKPLQYNESLKEIVDISEFKDSLVSLFEESGVNIKCGIVLNMPTVHFGSKELPLILGDEAVNEALISEVEQAYIFKKHEPLVRWVDSPIQTSGDMRKLFYAAIQKSEVEKIEAVLTEVGATLMGIEISLISVIRALAFSGVAEEQMKENVGWNLMVVNQNGYYLCPMINQAMVDYYEEPMPIKSFEGEEVYNALSSSAQITLMNYPAGYLYIISETDLVSAELLSKKLPFEGTKIPIENNIHKKLEIVQANLDILPDKAAKISLEAVGVGAAYIQSLPMKFSFALGASGEYGNEDDNAPVSIKIGERTFEISPNAAQKVAVLAGGALVVIAVIIAALFPLSLKHEQDRLVEVTQRADEVLAQYKQYEGDEGSGNFDADREMKKAMGDNRTKLMAYSALGEVVPKSLWVTYFVAKDDGKIDIKGQTSSAEDVYTFYKNMKDSLINAKLRLHKLELLSADSGDAVIALTSDAPVIYTFEITNMTDAELKPPEPGKKEGDAAASGTGAAPAAGAVSPPSSVPALEPVEP
jgi:hypothetical protein